MKHMKIVVSVCLALLCTGCVTTPLAMNSGPFEHPSWVPHALKVEALGKARFERLLVTEDFALLRAHIPWKKDRYFIEEDGVIIAEEKSIKKIMNAIPGQIVVLKENLPYQLRDSNANEYHIIYSAFGCNLIRVHGSLFTDELFIVRATVRAVQQFPTKKLSEAMKYFEEYIKTVDFRVAVTSSQAEVRLVMDTSALVIDKVKKKKTLKLIAYHGAWLEVLLDDGRTGFVLTIDVDEGILTLEPGMLATPTIVWKLYDGNTLIPAFSHLYGEGGFKGLGEINTQSADTSGITNGNQFASGLGLVLNLLSAGSSNNSSYAFANVCLVNEGDLPLTCSLEVGVPRFAMPATHTVIVEGGERLTVDLSPKFKDDIYEVTEQMPWEVYCTIKDKKGKMLSSTTQDIVIASRNDMVWHFNSGFDATPLFATFVTPRADFMDGLLRLSADYSDAKAIGGYQIGVADQMKAVYEALDFLDIKYVSTTISFSAQQRIRFPAEVIDEKAGNCIDLSLLYASAFEAMDMEPVIVLVPGHAFVGVRKSPGSTDILFLEATMTGYKSFETAINSAQETYTKYNVEGSVLEIDIAECRARGVTPAPITFT